MLMVMNYNQFHDAYLLTYKGSVWIGDIKSQTYAEPFISSANGGIYFTSFHSTPTGGQSAYIFANESKPLGLTIPHSTSYPQGVITTGITFNSGGYLNFNGENKFIGCQDETAAAIRSYKIYWGGSGTPEGLNCTGPLSIYEMNTCS
jgi:hypothetical protein